MTEDAKRVLIVDDDPDLRETLRVILEGNGYVVYEAATGEEGLRTYRETSPDIVIADLMMEEVDAGTRFVREIRALGEMPPVYLLSSVGDALHMNADWTDLGLTGVFQKPVDPKVLLATLKMQLS